MPETARFGWARAIAAASGVVAVAAIALVLTCCNRQVVELGPAQRLPQPEQLALPVPDLVHAPSDAITFASMRNVAFHVDDDALLGVRHLKGVLRGTRPDGIVVLDEKDRLELNMAHAEIALTARTLTVLLNRYIFGFRGSPLKDLVVRVEGDHIVQRGTMHRIIDIPFEMTAELSVTEDGWIRIHPIRMDICSLDGEKLLAAVGRDLEDLLDLSRGKGLKVEGNDILMDPLASLPPPRITGRLTAVRVENGEVVQTFGSPSAPGAEPMTPPVPATNYMYFRGGTIRFGKLYMVEAELLAIDTDTSDPFDFYLDHYHTQLVAGHHVTLPNYGLVAYMPDFSDVGTTKATVTTSRPNGRVPPP